MSTTQENKHEGQGRDKEFTIIVNGRQKVVTQKELSFAEIVALAFDNPPTGPNIVFTVTYRRGEGNKPEGTLIEGETVKVKEGMIFNVTATDKS
jgi:Multiubiquitin